jgi:hypothetical protein
MATEKIASKEAVEKALNSIGYSSVVNTDNPYYEIVSNKYFKIYIEEGNAGGDSPRRRFLEKLSETLNTKKYGFSSTYNPVRSGTPSSSIGKIVFNKSTIAIICKYHAELKNESSGKTIGLKPANITPLIVGKWLTPEVIIKNVKTYLKTNKIIDTPMGKQICQFMEESLNSKNDKIKIPGDVDEVLIPAEFVEVLTAIRMVTKLRRNDVKLLKDICTSPQKAGIGPFTKSSPLLIRIPIESNFKLYDFAISFIKNDYENIFKVSTKSKIKSENTNTVKFDQIFDSTRDVTSWFKKLDFHIKRRQFGPATVAFSALRFYGQSLKGKAGTKATKNKPAVPSRPAEKYAGKVKVGFPIDAVGHLLTRGPDIGNLSTVIISRSKIKNSKTGEFKPPTEAEIKAFGIVCQMITRNISGLDTTAMIDSFFTTDKKYQKYAVIAANLISTNNNQGGKGTSAKPAEPTLINLGKYCEKILEWASKRNSPTKHNYFRLFFQKVLQQREVLYAVSKSETIGRKENKITYVYFQYRSVNNWLKEYETWIELRKKDGDALGLAV